MDITHGPPHVLSSSLALAALFAPDADFVDITANWYKGRHEIQADIAFLFGIASPNNVRVTLPPQAYGILKGVTYRFDSIDVRFMNKDVAVAHVTWTQLGDARFKDKPRQGMLTFIVARGDNRWVFNTAHNSLRPQSN